MDGLLIIDKPLGMTSTRALDRVRRMTGQRKSGHAGTLDPSATGVLIVCLGRATKLVEGLMDLPKVYRVESRLDITSDSFDSEQGTRPVQIERIPAEDDVLATLASFVGTVEQIPPALSAVKIGGQPAYKRSRSGHVVELAPRPVRIDRIDSILLSWPVLTFEMECGRGTYVRALIRDVGERLGTGGCLTALERTRVGPFHVADALTLEGPPSREAVESHVISMERAIALLGG